MRPSGSSARKTGRPPLIVRISGTGWPGSVGVNLTGLLSTVIRYSSQTRPDHWDRYCDGTSDSLTAPASGAGSKARGPAGDRAGGTLLPARLGRDTVEHVAERAGALQVEVIQPGQLQPGVRHQPADRPVDVAAAEDPALERGEPALPPGHRLLW